MRIKSESKPFEIQNLILSQSFLAEKFSGIPLDVGVRLEKKNSDWQVLNISAEWNASFTDVCPNY